MKHHNKNIIHHTYLHPLVLCIIFGFTILAISLFQGKPDLQFLVGFIAAMSYILWGIVYHYIEGDLYVKVMIEYVLIAGIGLAILYTVLFI